MLRTTLIAMASAVLICVAGCGEIVEPAKAPTTPTSKPKTITAKDMPAPVQAAFAKGFPQGKIEKIDVDVENGVTLYDIEFSNGPAEQEADIAADGTIIEVTLVIDAKAVPAPAMKSIEKVAAGAKLGRIEKIDITYETKDGKVVKLAKPVTHYAAEYPKAAKTAEVVVTADGTVVEE